MSNLVYLVILGVFTLKTNAFLMNLLNPMNPMSPFNSEFMEAGEGPGFGMAGMGGGGMGGGGMRGGGGGMGGGGMGGRGMGAGGMMGNLMRRMMGRGGGGMFNPVNEMSDKMRDMYQIMALMRHSGMGGKAKTGGTPSAKTSPPPPPPGGRPKRPQRQRRPNSYCMFCMMTNNDCAQTACMFTQFNNMRF